MKTIDIASFDRDHDFYGKLNLLLTVKSFDLQAIRARYLASKGNDNQKIGSFKRREVALGGVVQCELQSGKTNTSQILAKLAEPRGISSREGNLAVSSENKVYLLSSDATKEISDPWFSYIHTVDYHPNQDVILVSSSGLDTLLEFDLNTGQKLQDWCAWDNGLNQSKVDESKTVTLTRSINDAKELEADGLEYNLITDPATQALPTAQRAAFINSSFYDPVNPRFVFATLFHEGSVRRIDMATGDSQIVLDGLSSPHGGMSFQEGTMVTNTRGGKVEYRSDFESFKLDFSNLEGKPAELGDAEWLQNSLNYNGIIVTIDSNRTSFVIIDINRKLYDTIPYDNNWAVQDLIIFDGNEALIDKLKELNQD